MNKKKDARRESAIDRFQAQLGSKVKTVGTEKIPLTPLDITRIKQDITNTKNRIGKSNTRRAKKTLGALESKGDKWFIDIYTVTYGYVKRSERRKNKGKSTKKLKKKKTVSFLKSVVAQEGMITAMKEGRSGLSPKTHVFKLRREELNAA